MYLIAIKGWNEISFGIVSLVMNVVMIAFQTPAGDLLDKTKKKKKLITVTSILIASLTTVLPVWTSNFWAILVGKTIEGISATVFLPALMALLLGICQTEAEVPSFIAITELSNKIGRYVVAFLAKLIFVRCKADSICIFLFLQLFVCLWERCNLLLRLPQC